MIEVFTNQNWTYISPYNHQGASLNEEKVCSYSLLMNFPYCILLLLKLAILVSDTIAKYTKNI